MEEKSMEEISFFWIFIIIITCGFGAILYILLNHKDEKLPKEIVTTPKKVGKEISEVKKEVVGQAKPEIDKTKGLTKRQVDILEFISTRGEAQPTELRKVAGDVSNRTVRRDMSVLIEKGLVEKKGSTKATYYKYIG